MEIDKPMPNEGNSGSYEKNAKKRDADPHQENIVPGLERHTKQ